MNRTTKPKEVLSPAYNPNEITIDRPSKQITTDDIESNKKDVASLSSDLKLLSTLLGRPVSQRDLPNLVGKTTDKPLRGPAQTTLASNRLQTTISATSTATTANPTLVREVELLQKIVPKPSDETSTDVDTNDDDKYLSPIETDDAYGKTNDALLATLLKQRGIGPAHNNLPLNLYTTTTTTRPIQAYPSRSARPILDGLTWLWRTWQDTAPGIGGYQHTSQTRTRGASNDNNNSAHQNLQTENSPNFDDGLDSDTSSVIQLKKIRTLYLFIVIYNCFYAKSYLIFVHLAVNIF